MLCYNTLCLKYMQWTCTNYSKDQLLGIIKIGIYQFEFLKIQTRAAPKPPTQEAPPRLVILQKVNN